jgi:hypothetical protein
MDPAFAYGEAAVCLFAHGAADSSFADAALPSLAFADVC